MNRVAFLPAAVWIWLAAACHAAAPSARHVDADAEGRLTYAADARGNRVPDFSNCGYRGGGVPIPDAPVRVVVPPSAGDNGRAIQAAIDYVSGLERGADGLRGAVLLLKGRHEVSARLRVATSGVVVRGQGDGPEGTTLVALGVDRRALITLAGREEAPADTGVAVTIADAYVPVGARRFRIEKAGAFREGDAVVVDHPGTAAWVASLGMDKFPPGDKGGWLKWAPDTINARFDRVITRVEADVVTVDAPLTTAFDRSLGGGRVYRANASGRVDRVGVENLRCVAETDPGNPKDEQHAWDAIAFESARDAWARRVAVEGFAGSAVRVGDDGLHVTVEDATSTRPVSEDGGYRRMTFLTRGQLTLFQRCRSESGRNDFAAGVASAGPNAFVGCESVASSGFSGPVESWATGVLYDNVTVDGGGLALTDREVDGQGVGWAAANCVLWQCTAPVVTCRNPPGAQNWAIGCWGQFVGDGHWQTPNEFVKPESLYRAQLAERLGKAAVAATAPRPIPADPEGAPAVADLPRPPTALPEVPPGRPLSLRNGWLLTGGSLLTGARTGTVWWRGSVVPARAAGFGVGVTRFVPGRDGPGFTDDLGGLTDSMLAAHKVALEHHWGLWYDRRRDDHQMVRRPDGGVWAPFYEQPWDRSGRGLAWDGLSKYDLTRFNPWYFARLDEFAGLCDRKGLVLLHEDYFQHNILEAGAHWADFAWRPANCLQETGFPEPPPYAGKKRVFMADHFYDLSHPLRRDLHRLYIRKGLDTLGRHPNVVFLTGEEYTGPLEFVRFWLDTVTAWERETGRDVLVGLSATKDVQDAILTDPIRGPAVSVIEFKYWWPTPGGGLFEPKAGENLSPRQQLREWKGDRSRSQGETARQVREYRRGYPDKAVILAYDRLDPWSVVASGGSMAELPATLDPGLAADIPRMTPVDPGGDRLGLAGPGRGYLVYAPSGGPVRLDLGSDAEAYAVRRVDPGSGVASNPTARVRGGGLVEIPRGSGPESAATLIWLTRDEAPRP